jgi:hypothetical protein
MLSPMSKYPVNHPDLFDVIIIIMKDWTSFDIIINVMSDWTSQLKCTMYGFDIGLELVFLLIIGFEP